MIVKLPKYIARGHLDPDAELTIAEGVGVYVTVTRTDTGAQVELPEEGPGDDESLARIIKSVRQDRRRYVLERVQQALADTWSREQLGVPAR